MTPLLSAIERIQKYYYEDYGHPPKKIWISGLLIARMQKELAEMGILRYQPDFSQPTILGMEVQPNELLGKKLPDYLICIG